MALLDLPNELLLAIKGDLGRDLLAHVCYFKLCTRTKACYDDIVAPPVFWKRLVRANGLGLSNLETDSGTFWRAIAFQCAEHAQGCGHPACGARRLDENRLLVQKVEAEWPNWNILEAIPARLPRDTMPHGPEYCSSIFSHIDFTYEFPSPLDSEEERAIDITKCAFLRPELARQWQVADVMQNHPIALRSFVSLPPLSGMDLMNPRSTEIDGTSDRPLKTSNSAGITVHDLLTMLSEYLGRPMTCFELYELLNPTPEVVIPSTWTRDDVLSAAGWSGSRFQLSKWKGIDLVVHDRDGAFFESTFEPRELPEDPKEHEHTEAEETADHVYLKSLSFLSLFPLSANFNLDRTQERGYS